MHPLPRRRTRYGQFALALSLIGLFGVLADAGLTTIVVRELAQRPGARRRAASASRSRCAPGSRSPRVVAAAVARARPPLPRRDVRVAILIAGGPDGARAVHERLVAVAAQARPARRQRRDRRRGRPAAALAAVAIVIWLDLGFYAVVAAAAVGAAVTLAVDVALARPLLPRAPAPPTAAESRALLRAALPVGAALAVNEVYFRADALIISLSRSYEELGRYALAWRISELAAVFPGGPAGLGLPAALSRYVADRRPAPAPRRCRRPATCSACSGSALAVGGAIVAPAGSPAALGGEAFARLGGAAAASCCARPRWAT